MSFHEHKDADPYASMHHMIASDVLLKSDSGFSNVASLYSAAVPHATPTTPTAVSPRRFRGGGFAIAVRPGSCAADGPCPNSVLSAVLACAPAAGEAGLRAARGPFSAGHVGHVARPPRRHHARAFYVPAACPSPLESERATGAAGAAGARR